VDFCDDADFVLPLVFVKYETATPQSTKKAKKAGLFDSPLLLPKVVFILVQIIPILMGLYKCQAMGLLPTATSDWLAWLRTKAASHLKICAYGRFCLTIGLFLECRPWKARWED
jgi:hypothetical protein